MSALKKLRTKEDIANDIKVCAESIITNAESIVGTEKYMTDLTVTIYITAGEPPRVNVDRNFMPEGVIDANRN